MDMVKAADRNLEERDERRNAYKDAIEAAERHPVRKYQHKVIRLDWADTKHGTLGFGFHATKSSALEAELNALGAKGWELVDVAAERLFLKREIA